MMAPKNPTVASPRPRRYSQAFHEPALSANAKTTRAPQPTAESFYFQKQMQQQTPMVAVLDDGERIEGILEWYDAASLKFRRSNGSRVLVYKHAIKYLHKQPGSPHEPE
jgi:sRNA-binding regulator protein Hfq